MTTPTQAEHRATIADRLTARGLSGVVHHVIVAVAGNA